MFQIHKTSPLASPIIMQSLFDTIPQAPNSQLPANAGFLFCDGGSRGNPGPAAGAAVLYNEKKEIIGTDTHFSNHQTNNYAEYMGVIIGLKLALKKEITDLVVTLDSKLIVEQMNGNWKVKNANIKPLFSQAKDLSGKFSKITFAHTLREGNKVADQLVNDEMDRRR